MKAIRLAAALACLTLLPAAASRDDVPSFKDRGDDEKAFVARVGEAVVRAARLGPLKIALEKYEFSDPRKGRKDLKITMTWAGGILKKKYTSQIVVKIDSSDKDRWQVLDIEYKDDSRSLASPNRTRIQELVKKLNR